MPSRRPRLHVVIDVPAAVHRDAAALWEQVIGWSLGDPWPGHPELASLEPPAGSAYAHLQRVDGPAGVHLDVEVPDRDQEVRRAQGLGASLVRRQDQWTTLTSPGGLPFCVVGGRGADGSLPPEPVAWGDGHRSRLVQVCLDSPAAVHEKEVAFWGALLGERWSPSGAPEFAGKWHDDAGGPLQLLFQRLDEDEGSVRAHVDLGTDDLAAEVRRLVALGLEDVGRGGGWHVLRDPWGGLLCATENSPEPLRRRHLG